MFFTRLESLEARSAVTKERLEPTGWIVDTFARDCPRGDTDGSKSDSGHERIVTDAEGVIGIDHGAMRIGQMVQPGWGRFGVAYGPLRRQPGLVMAVSLVNGHNLSQAYTLKNFGAHLRRWIRGCGAQPPWRQMLNWALWHRPREPLSRKLRAWWRHRARPGSDPALLRENLAVGFFGESSPRRPLERGNALLVRAAEHYRNGELCAGVCGRAAAAFNRLQNVQVQYVVVLRARGAAYYAAGPTGAHGLGGFPRMRPVGIDASDETAELYAGVHQGVLGEIGFGIDSRIHGVKVGHVPELEKWYGSAHAADALTGSDSAALSEAEAGGKWRVEGAVSRSSGGAGGDGSAWLPAAEPSGLLHAIVQRGEGDGSALLQWQRSEAGDCLRLELRGRGAALVGVRGGEQERLAHDATVRLGVGEAAAVQILDDGDSVTVAVDGRVVFGGPVERPEAHDGCGVGFGVAGGWVVRDFEAHAREVPIPEEARLARPWSSAGRREVVRDSFVALPGPLEGRRVEVGDGRWRRAWGKGAIDVAEEGFARVRASPRSPAPGRTIYTVDWHDPAFADFEAELTPPGTGPKEGHRCRAGLCLWQDRRNYIVVNIWLSDVAEAASVSSFFFIRGFEDVFDAAWSNVGTPHLMHGRPVRLRMISDGGRYRMLVNGEPVLYRAFSDVYPTWERLAINRIGLAVNWEWGEDTGTTLSSFVARDRGTRPVRTGPRRSGTAR